MTSTEDEDARPEHAVTLGLLAVLQAEGVVSSAWSAELAGQAEAAWRRHAAAKGRMTRALKDGSAARIVEARRREGEAYRAADLIARACLAELGELNLARLASLDSMSAQMDRRENRSGP